MLGAPKIQINSKVLVLEEIETTVTMLVLILSRSNVRVLHVHEGPRHFDQERTQSFVATQ